LMRFIAEQSAIRPQVQLAEGRISLRHDHRSIHAVFSAVF